MLSPIKKLFIVTEGDRYRTRPSSVLECWLFQVTIHTHDSASNNSLGNKDDEKATSVSLTRKVDFAEEHELSERVGCFNNACLDFIYIHHPIYPS